jgi:hypothetical protein
MAHLGDTPGPPQRQDTVVQDPFENLTLDPPSPEQQPLITAEEASATAWDNRPPGGAQSEEDTFALLSDSAHDRTPAWVITYGGACVPAFGPTQTQGSETPCDSQWNVLVDATTGEFIVLYADPDVAP